MVHGNRLARRSRRRRLRLQGISEDPDDDKYLGAAVEGRAAYVVSGDPHLLDIGEHAGIPIVTPREFLETLRR